MASYLHSVIEANRTIYSQYLVDRLKETVKLNATENWEEAHTLPLPAQFLAMSADRVRSQNLGLQYRLISLWPINPENGPESNIEEKALKKISKPSETPFAWIDESKGDLTFNTLYPDRAITRQCTICHNNHPDSGKKDFKMGDVMGGILVRFPIHSANDGRNTYFYVPPETAADYIHAILEADRAVYAKHVVHRLEKNKVSYASANWWEDNALLLPAQFLLNASDLIQNLRLGFHYRLISLWPVNPHNGPGNKFERLGLKALAQSPVHPYKRTLLSGNREFFQAMYPDRATTPSCVKCHNAHPESPRHNFRLFDVMGAIVVSIPLDREEELVSFAPEE
ncbi:Tll0287-like domain-containing protein [Nitrospina gracilis]|uniref:Tll0287-like domain-containing protein n=1 Tax=Nitrospina gracilis TaxID=35801 RepID=UPI001FD32DF9|nr:DUF3365 domain-containing protein [Nitrospina gracilis]